MGRKNRIQSELPPDLREALDQLILDDQSTIDDLREWLAERGHGGISRSGVARYKLSREDVIAKMRESREMAKGLGEALGPDDGDGSRNAQLREMLDALIHGGMMRLLADPDAEVTALDLSRLAKTLQSANSAQKLDIESRIKKVEHDASKAAKREAVEAAVAVIDKPRSGETPEAALKRIREEIYGLAPP